MTTIYSIAQNLICCNKVFLTNGVNQPIFINSDCPYTYRMVETLSLYLLMVANDVGKIFFFSYEMALHETPRTVGIFDLPALVFEE